MKPRQHQIDALADICEGLKQHTCGQVLMACGTGKTLVGLWAAEQSKAQKILVLAPSLALIRQLLGEYRLNASWGRWSALAVCSDDSVAETDSIHVDVSEVGCPVTTNPADVPVFLRKRGVRVVFCTYHSAPLLAGLSFDLALFDEAHKTSGVKDKAFGFALHDENVRCAKRLFFTATPRVVKVGTKEGSEDEVVYSMDNEAVYGPVFHKLSFRKAVDQGIICRYELVISEITEAVDTDNHAAVQVALQKAIDKLGIKKIFTFHRTVADAREFAEDKFSVFDGKVSHHHVNGMMPTSTRDAEMNMFKRADAAVMSNARCLTEGVDVPAVDMVAFLSPKKSLVDIVQAAGRGMRIPAGSKKDCCYIFIPLFRDLGAGETYEDATERARFRPVLDVLKALEDQDEMLRAVMDNIREREAGGEGGGGGGELPVIIMGPDVEALKRAVQAAVVKGSTNGGRLPTQRKKLLLEMARRGDARPACHTPLGFALPHYTNPSSSGYDAHFTAELGLLRPSWVWQQRVTKEMIKADLLECARKGTKPTSKRLCKALYHYMAADALFEAAIISLQPSWARRGKPTERMEELLLRARSGAPKPKYGTKLWRTWRDLMDRYPAFKAELYAIAPQWSLVGYSAAKKEQFLARARRGEPRPLCRAHNKTELSDARSLKSWVDPRSDYYDAIFAAEITKTAWAV